jgi:hypothetical protein
LIEIDLPRPQSWRYVCTAETGAMIPVDFGRMGIVGPAKVESIRAYPEIRPDHANQSPAATAATTLTP